MDGKAERSAARAIFSSPSLKGGFPKMEVLMKLFFNKCYKRHKYDKLNQPRLSSHRNRRERPRAFVPEEEIAPPF